jgi:hypothetical protein
MVSQGIDKTIRSLEAFFSSRFHYPYPYILQTVQPFQIDEL